MPYSNDLKSVMLTLVITLFYVTDLAMRRLVENEWPKRFLPLDHFLFFFFVPDCGVHLNQGKFRTNGGCGYILKPYSLRNRGKLSKSNRK